MEEKAELLQRNSGNRKSYGSVAKYSESPEDEYDRPPRCLCTRRDCILVSILSVLVATAIIVSLSIGIPKIQSKQQNRAINIDITESPVSPAQSGLSSPKPSFASSLIPSTMSSVLNIESMPTNPQPEMLAPNNSTLKMDNSTVVLKQSAMYKRAAVSADDARCAEVGSKILSENGSAVDAAISALLCLEAVNPQHSGIAGGFFMLIYSNKENKTYAIDARETAPAKATKDMLMKSNDSIGLQVGIPGVIRGMSEAHKRFGRKPWDQLFQPTINLCTVGYSVNSALAKALTEAKDTILQEISLHELFVNNITGDVLQENDTLKRPNLAKTLQILAKQGEKEFYEGEIAKQLVTDIQAKGGIITLDDMRNYTVHVKEPLTARLGGHQLHVHTMPPPSTGALLIFVLNLLDSYNVSATNLSNTDYVKFLQRLVESYKFSHALKSYLGDERFINVSELITNITSTAFALEIRKYINDNATFEPEYYLNRTLLPPSDHGTTHVNVFAPDGDVVSVTNTINNRFGAKFRSRSLDIIFNDEMNDFSSPPIKGESNQLPSASNSIAPGKRPLSSMMPSIIFGHSGAPLLAIGGSGGTGIFTSMANVLAHYFILNQCIEGAITAPRMHHELVPNVLKMETTFPMMYIQALSRIGHNISIPAKETHVNAVRKMSNGTVQAVGDPRIAIGIAGF